MFSTIAGSRRPARHFLAGTVVIALLSASCNADNSTPASGTPTSLTIAAGDGLNETVGAEIGPFVVKVADSSGNVVPNVTVNFVASAGLTLVNSTATTSAQGTAFTSGTFGHVAGVFTVTATVSGISTPLIFQETANPDVASSFTAAGGDNQTAPRGTQLSDPLVTALTDQYNNPINAASVTWSAAAGTLSNISTHTGSTGRSQATYTLPPGAGVQTVTAAATIGGVQVTVTFHETGT